MIDEIKLNGLSDEEKIKFLVKELNVARKVYEQDNTEIMSNFEYDKYYNMLLDLEDKTGIVLPESPTQNVGYDSTGDFEKFKHEYPALSLKKTKDLDDLKKFLGQEDGVLSYKLDGLTVVLYYENGSLLRAVTRGNGEIGEVVTHTVVNFKGFPKKIEFKEPLVVRCEALINVDDFENYNKTLSDDDQKALARNLASGSVRTKDANDVKDRPVRLIAFDILNDEQLEFTKYSEELEWLESKGFETVKHKSVNNGTLELVMNEFTETVTNGTFKSPADGLVLRLNNLKMGRLLGRTNHDINHSIAFKWEDKSYPAVLKDIKWQVGRTGKITPVAIFDPIKIEGSTVQKASLHNITVLFEKLGNAYRGEKINVYKANMIIPQIADAEKKATVDESIKIKVPANCPICGGPITVDRRNVEDRTIVDIYCKNSDCYGKSIQELSTFVSRPCMNIDGLSERTIETFVEEGLITDKVSIFKLDEHPEIRHLEGWGAQSYFNLIDSIDKARNVKLENFINALGIENVGIKTSKDLARSFEYSLKALVNASYEELLSVEGIGENTASTIFNYFNSSENLIELAELLEQVHIEKEVVVKVDKGNPIYGKTFCVTGSAEPYTSRKEIETIIINGGGKLTGSVSNKTDYLITNDTTSGSAKNVKATELGIPKITVYEFKEKFVDIQ